jgi:hypothetical protein
MKRDMEIFNKAFKKSTQSINDQKLEIFTYSSINEIKRGCKEKIYHGEGPFILKFKTLNNIV